MLKIINPANHALIDELPEDSEKSIQDKFDRAYLAQKDWKRTPMSQRLEIMRGFRDLLVEKRETLSKTLTLEVGKPISQSRNELNGVIGRIDFFLNQTERALGEELVYQDPQSGLEEKITHEPLGVIANISAWNYPYFVGSNVFVPALLGGNAVLYKPSEFASLTGKAIGTLLFEAGLPKDLFAVVYGTGQVGNQILDLPIQGVFFTGSFPTGKKIAQKVSGRMIKTQLELGGKDPIYVCSDADIKKVAPAIADGAFYNTGQSCCSVERIYVHSSVYNAFMESFMETVQSFVMGDPMIDSTYIGPVTRKAQLEFLAYQVDDALKQNAKLLHGGKRTQSSGNFFEPTVFAEVNHKMSLMREETFGPMIGIQKVANDEEAIQLKNDTEYGLTAGVYTPDKSRAEKILSEINSGTVYWNCCDRVSPRLPWTGRGNSGMGSTLSTYGIQTFAQLKAWHLKN